MNKTKSYTGLDYFRMAAALFIIAIHTSPLQSQSALADFIFTRIIARTAVPFFFMTSGFFLIRRYNRDNQKLCHFLKETGLIYLAAMLLYLPVNIYNGYFKMDSLLPNLIKDIVFDGTLYHLWYLPAAMLGAVLAWYLVRKAGFAKALVISILLYVLGLLGDSYYGITEQITPLKKLYDNFFTISDYTRNGIFLAPVFFILGGMIANRSRRENLKKNLIGLVSSAALLLGEGLLLHSLDMQRHDSMYVMLLPCMYYLFKSLLCFRGKRVRMLRDVSFVTYLIHPMMIVILRMTAKVLHMQSVLLENSLVYYVTVSVLSVGAAAAVCLFYRNFTGKKPPHSRDNGKRAWIEIDEENLGHNVRTLEQVMHKKCKLMAVVKAEAYGHGAFEISAALERMGVDAFAAATLEEGISLRKYGIRGEILILGYTSPLHAGELHRYKLTQTVIDYDYGAAMNRQGYQLQVHIKLDTGMHRLGFAPSDISKIKRTFESKNLTVTGIYTHLCAADSLAEEDTAYTEAQISTFYQILEQLKQNHITIPKTHIQSSYGLLNYPELACDYVRAGVALYGVKSHPLDETRLQLGLRPVLSLKARIVLVRELQKGESAGYGRDFVAVRDTTTAILPVGYADGIPRSLSNQNAEVLIRGYRAPVIGRICMDQMILDVTDIPDIKTGEIVTVIGDSNDERITAADMAAGAQSISNEILSRLGTRLR